MLLEIENIKSEYFITINYKNCNNICTLKQHNTSIKLVTEGPTDRQTDIVAYRAAIAAKKNLKTRIEMRSSGLAISVW